MAVTVSMVTSRKEVRPSCAIPPPPLNCKGRARGPRLGEPSLDAVSPWLTFRQNAEDFRVW